MDFDFDAAVQAPFRMQPGLRRMADGAGHLTPAGRHSRHLHEKLAALQEAPQAALLCTPGFDAGPALHTLARQAAREYPLAFTWDGRTAVCLELGWAVDDAGRLAPGPAALPAVGECLGRLPEAWRLPALLLLAFAEDFAILDGRTAHIPWLAVTLPSHWAPQDKLGRHFAQVHAPVADNRMLVSAADALARLVSGPTRWERFVWTLTAHPHLNAHPGLRPATRWQPGDADSVAAQAWWRTERQTFIPVESVTQALFTIQVQVQPLAQALDSPARAARVHDALASMSPAVLHYRSLDTVRDALLQWLARRAAA